MFLSSVFVKNFLFGIFVIALCENSISILYLDISILLYAITANYINILDNTTPTGSITLHSQHCTYFGTFMNKVKCKT